VVSVETNWKYWTEEEHTISSVGKGNVTFNVSVKKLQRNEVIFVGSRLTLGEILFVVYWLKRDQQKVLVHEQKCPWLATVQKEKNTPNLTLPNLQVPLISRCAKEKKDTEPSLT